MKPVSAVKAVQRFGKPWLLVGKGPSFAGIETRDLSAYSVMGINHVCLRVRCDIAFFTDSEAMEECRPFTQAAWVVMPWWPHERMRPGKRTAAEYGITRPLGVFNSTMDRRRDKRWPLVRVKYFSAVAAVNLLLAAGARTIRTAGIDGGTLYAPGFDIKHRLANGRGSFDIQLVEIEKAARKASARVKRI